MVVKINGVIRDILIKISLRQRKKTRQNKLVGETGSFSLLLWLRSPCSEQGSRLEFLSRGPNDILDWMSLSCGGFSQGMFSNTSSTPAVVTTENTPRMALGGKSQLEQKQWGTETSCRFPPSLTCVPTLPAAKLYPPWRAIPSLQSQEVVHICGNQLYWGSLCLIVTYFHKNCQPREDKAHTQQWGQSWHSKTNFTRNKYGREKMWFK